MNIANKSGSTYISNGGGICCVIVGEGVDIVINNTGSSETRSTRPILEMPPVVDESPEAVRGVMDGYVLEADLTEEEITVIHALYEKWEAGQDYPKDKILSHNQTLYRVIQAHTSQSDWEPQNVPALFVRAVPENVIPDWVQPTGAHDAYQVGDRVLFNGHVYESKINANVWSPTAYPAGWLLID